ncbi:MAG: DUF393 domain-containing protein [Sphingobacteriales bacterium]|nr:MAG: DUF393 domain-containing protein [Sphingobacteriales bacterium]
MDTEKGVVLFDGVCNLCNHSVQLIIKQDKQDYFRFAALDSDFGKAMSSKYHIAADSIVLIEKDQVYTQSDAALRIARHLSGIYPVLYAAMIIPKFIRDRIYRLIARNRYRWFGKRQACWMPSAQLSKKFLA